MHGNAVSAAGVRHIVGLPWDAGGLVLLVGSAITGAASAWLLDVAVAGRDEAQMTVLRIDASLELHVKTATAWPVGDGSWRLADRTALAAAADGLPVLVASDGWPLEEP